MKKIVILGAGFAGIRAALNAEKIFRGRAEVILIDKNSYHLFTPALYEVASAYGIKREPHAVTLRQTVAVPIKDIIDLTSIKFIQAEVRVVDLKEKKISISGGEELPFDSLVIALGSQTSDFGVNGVAKYSIPFKTIGDALRVYNQIEKLFRDAGDGKLVLPIKIFVIGAGFTGIELASEIANCARKLSHDFGLNKKAYQISLFEQAPKILPMVSDEEREVVVKRLTELGIIIMANSQIEEINGQSLRMKDGHVLHGSAIIWTAGVMPNTFLKSISDLPLTEKGKVKVDQYLRVLGFDSIYAAGDIIDFIDPITQKQIPAMAFNAIEQAKLIVKNIYLSSQERKLKPYQPKPGSWIAPIGGKWALAHTGLLDLKGLPGWVIREIVDFRYLNSILSFNKAATLFRNEIKFFTRND